MSVQPVRLFGDPVLRTTAESVGVDHIGDERVQRLVRDLLDTVRHESGAGMAAPQIGVGLRVFVHDCDGHTGALIDPSWEPVGTEMATEREGCLSIPDIRAATERHARVRVRGHDAAGRTVDFECGGLLARCVQHETDHLDGVLFPQRLGADERRRVMREIRESDWFGAAAISGGNLVAPAGTGVAR